jgi:hypothetical protein
METRRSYWTSWEESLLRKLDTPFHIQAFLDDCAYNTTKETRSVRFILKHKRAHCMEGAMFAAACLEYHGMPPLVLDMKAENDDDHVIAVYKVKNFWGAVAKSNFTTLRFREPVYRSLRELAMSYFDLYFNTDGDKSLRSYSLPCNLTRFDNMEWRTTEGDLEEIGNYLDTVRHYPLITTEQIKTLEKASPLLLESSLAGADPAGLFRPKSNG